MWLDRSRQRRCRVCHMRKEATSLKPRGDSFIAYATARSSIEKHDGRQRPQTRLLHPRPRPRCRSGTSGIPHEHFGMHVLTPLSSLDSPSSSTTSPAKFSLDSIPTPGRKRRHSRRLLRRRVGCRVYSPVTIEKDRERMTTPTMRRRREGPAHIRMRERRKRSWSSTHTSRR